ncbi:General stress protein A [Planctomycetes bacterium CA13]|uniref:General stress protein A n=1 Tax=Novipirellula herctigrandis TaxID=2527986 RepID=A0A5C5YNJ5_9BACT|nr:General stress protein A [Planctomycetes bacterium CA13]
MKTVEPIVVVSGCDEAYAMPLAVTLRSVIDHLDPMQTIQLYIFDGGIAEASQQKIAESVRDERVSIAFRKIDMAMLKDVPVSGHVSAASYLRILIPSVLPKSVKRVIYLDSDLLICKNLAELWRSPLNGNAVLAAQDAAAPYIDSASTISNFHDCKHYIVSPTPVANHKALAMSPDAKYFNAGLLVIDVDHWRHEKIDEQLFSCLQEHREHVLWWDQYALNVVMYGRWGELDGRWNQGAHFHAYPSASESPFDQKAFSQLKHDPWVIHFTSALKPWHYFCPHPEAYQFQHYLSRTAWADYEPERPSDFIHLWWKHQTRTAKNKFRRRKRIIRRMFQTDERRAA